MADFNLSLGRKGKAGEFDSTEIKEGTKKTDFESKISQNIFDALDKDKDGTLNGIEVEKFLAQLKDAAKNDNLSKREAKKLLKLEGIKGVKAEKLFEFLKEIAAVEVEEDYSAYNDGMGVDIKNKPNPTPETEVQEDAAEEIEEERIDNSKAYFENGRIMTLGDDGKSILVQENESSEPVKLQVDEDGNVISYAKNGESFKMTAKRLGIPLNGSEFEKFKELNEKASKKGYFLVGGKVTVPSESIEKLALDKVNVNPDNEIAAYVKFMAKKRAEAEKPDKPVAEKPKADPPKKDERPVNTEGKTVSGNPMQLKVKKEDFIIESLRKRYVSDKYSESKDDEGVISFINKKTGKAVFRVNYNDNGDFVAYTYKNDKKQTAIEFNKDENTFIRQQFDDNQNIKSEAFYDGSDGKIKREFLANPDGTVTKAISYNKNGNKTDEKIYRSDKEDDFETTYYQNDGTVISKYDGLTGKHDCPIANELQGFIYAKNALGLPVSKDKEIKETILNKINSENVDVILEAYKQSTGIDLLTDVSDEWAISSSDLKEIKAYLTKCLENKRDYKTDFENQNSQVKNEFHTGPEFTIKQKDAVISVKNKSTGKEHSVDLDKLLQNLSPDKQVKLKQIIQNLPGEVLEDLCIEVDTFYESEKEGNTGAYYNGGSNKLFNIVFNGSDSITMIEINQNNLVHEIGHAVDFNGYLSNTSTIADNKQFRQVNQQEMKSYLDSGNKRFDEDDETTHSSTQNDFNYCTLNDKEMFAECYALLMTGECNSKECILKYFPETLKAVEQHINDIRKLPESKRH